VVVRKGQPPPALIGGSIGRSWCGSHYEPDANGRQNELKKPHPNRRANLDAQAETIEIMHVLKPIGVCMAGADEFDPYKD